MYKSEKSGLTVYETFDELLDAEMYGMYEFEGFYYVETKPEDFFDGTVWKVDKQTERLTTIHYTETLEIPDEERIPIVVEEFKRKRAG